MQSIYRLKDRLDVMGCKCDYCTESGTSNFQKAKFKDDYKLIPPKAEPSETYSQRLSEYETELARVNALSLRPSVDSILSVRNEIGLIDYLSEIIMELVPNPDADFFEDDYYATVWRDTRPMPSFADVTSDYAKLKLKQRHARFKAAEKLALTRSKELPESKKVDLFLGLLPDAEKLKIIDKIKKAEADYAAELTVINSATSLDQIP